MYNIRNSSNQVIYNTRNQINQVMYIKSSEATIYNEEAPAFGKLFRAVLMALPVSAPPLGVFWDPPRVMVDPYPSLSVTWHLASSFEGGPPQGHLVAHPYLPVTCGEF